MTNIDYRRAFKIACDLLNGDVFYGVDTDKIFELMIQKDGVVSSRSYEEYILNHLQELDQGQYASNSENPTGSIIDWNNCHTSEQLDSISTIKNNLVVVAVSRDEVCRYVAEFVNHEFSTKEEEELIDNIITGIKHMPPVTPQEPRKGHWTEEFNALEGEVRFTCSSCGKYQLFGTDFCYHCGSDNREVVEE